MLPADCDKGVEVVDVWPLPLPLRLGRTAEFKAGAMLGVSPLTLGTTLPGTGTGTGDAMLIVRCATRK